MKMPVFLNNIGSNTVAACGPILVVRHGNEKTVFCVTVMESSGIDGETIQAFEVQKPLDLDKLMFDISSESGLTRMVVSIDKIGINATITEGGVEYECYDGYKTVIYRMATYDNKVRIIKKCVS